MDLFKERGRDYPCREITAPLLFIVIFTTNGKYQKPLRGKRVAPGPLKKLYF